MADARIKEIRLENFLNLFEQFKARVRETFPNEPERGMLTRFADELGISKAFLSHVKTGKKPIGDQTALKIEQALGLEHGWMDVIHADETVESLSPMKQEVVAMFVELLKSGSESAAAEVMKVVREKMSGSK